MWRFCSFVVVILNVFILSVYSNDPVNIKHSVGFDVVTAAIRRIQDTCIFNNDLLFLHRIAFQESNDGNNLINVWDTNIGRAGIWQNDESILETLQDSSDSLTEEQRIALTEKLQMNITDLNWESGDLEVPLNSVAVARMFISTFENSLIPYDLKGQAEFWEKHYKSPDNNFTAQDFIHNSNKMKKCKPPGMDLIFIIDSSASIEPANFELARNFMVSMINSSFENQINNNRIGIIRFSSDAILFLNLTNDFEEASRVAETLPYDSGGNTNIFSGFNLAAQIFASDGREEVPMVALLITDGQANIGGDPTLAADDLKSLGVNLFAIGVGEEATTDLHIWASSPNCMFYYSLNNYMQLATVFPELLNAQICDVSAVVPDTQTSVPGTVEKDQYLFYQVPANLSTGLTLKLDIHEGAATVYASLTSRLPSSADYDFIANATSENLGQIYISPNELQNAQSGSSSIISDFMILEKSEATVFTAIVGLSETTNFTLHYEPEDTVVTTISSTTEVTVASTIESIEATSGVTSTTTPTEVTTTITTAESIETPESPVSGTVYHDLPLYYQIPANITDGLSLTVDIEDGFALIFVSLTSKTPSSLNNEYFSVATTQNPGIINISPDQLETAYNNSFMSDMISFESNDVMVYISIVSIAGETNFTLYYGPDESVFLTTTTTTTVTIPITSASITTGTPKRSSLIATTQTTKSPTTFTEASVNLSTTDKITTEPSPTIPPSREILTSTLTNSRTSEQTTTDILSTKIWSSSITPIPSETNSSPVTTTTTSPTKSSTVKSDAIQKILPTFFVVLLIFILL